MKLMMMTSDTEDLLDYEYLPLYINEGLIAGFFVPKETEEEEQIVNIIYPGLDIVSVILSDELRAFLTDKFNLPK